MKNKILSAGLAGLMGIYSIIAPYSANVSNGLSTKPESITVDITEAKQQFGFYDQKVPGNYNTLTWSVISSEKEEEIYTSVVSLKEDLDKRIEEFNELECVPSEYAEVTESGVLDYRGEMYLCIKSLEQRIKYGCDNLSYQLSLVAKETVGDKKVLVTDYLNQLGQSTSYIDNRYSYYEPISENVGTTTTVEDMKRLVNSWRDKIQATYNDCVSHNRGVTQEEINGLQDDYNYFGSVLTLITYGETANNIVRSSISDLVLSNGGKLPINLVTVVTAEPSATDTVQTPEVLTSSAPITDRPSVTATVQTPVSYTESPTVRPTENVNKATQNPGILATNTPGVMRTQTPNNSNTTQAPVIETQVPTDVTQTPSGSNKITVTANTRAPSVSTGDSVKQISSTKSPTSKLSCSKKSITLGKGESYKLPVKGTGKLKVVYTNSNGNIKVSKKGVVTGKQVGSGKVYIICGGKTVTVNVKVKSAPKYINFKVSNIVINRNYSQKVGIRLSKGSASNKIIWKSSNPKVATISKGKLVAKKPGPTVISVTTYNKKTARIQVTVK